MTNTQGNVQESIWRDRQFRGLTRSAQCTYIQLLCQKELDRAGILPYQPTKWAKGCDAMSLGELESDIVELQRARFVYLDDETDELLVRTYLRKESAKHPNHLKAGFRAAKAVASRMLRAVLVAELTLIGTADAKAIAGEIDPGEHHDPDATPMPSASHPDGIDMASRSDMPSRCHPDPTGMGMGKGTNGTLSNNSTTATSASRERAHTREAATEFANGEPIPAEPPADTWTPPTDGATALTPDRIENPRPANVVPIGDGISTLIRLAVRTPLGHSERTKLEAQVQRLLRDPNIDRCDVEAALADWDTRERAGIGLLPSLVTDAAKRRIAAGNKRTGIGKPSTKARGIQNATDQLIASMNNQENRP